MCLSVCVTQPRPFSYFSSFLLRQLHASHSFCPPPLLTKTTQGISLSSNSFSHPYKYIKMCLFLLFIHIKMCFI